MCRLQSRLGRNAFKNKNIRKISFAGKEGSTVFSSICDFNGCFTFYTLFFVNCANKQFDVFIMNFMWGQWAHTCQCMLFDT